MSFRDYITQENWVHFIHLHGYWFVHIPSGSLYGHILLLLLSFFYSFEIFSHQRLSDSKSPQVSRTILSILADLNNAVIWMAYTRSLLSSVPSNSV